MRTFSTVANPIFFDIIEDKTGNQLFQSQVDWISIGTITQAVSELAFNGMMIVYLIQPYLEKDADEKIEVN